MEIRKFVTPEIVMGSGSISLSGSYAQNFGSKKVLIVTDPGVQKAGWTAVAEKSLKSNNIPYVIYNEVTSNPRVNEVMNGAEFFNQNNCDMILAVGGGSPIDCAKGIGIVSTNKKSIDEFLGVDEVDFPMPPLICIPTTAGSAADISQFAIISNRVTRQKVTIISKTVVPDVSLIDPIVTTTKDHLLTAATAIDTMVHAIEAYVSNASSIFSDLPSLAAIELVYNNLIPCLNDPQNLTYRDALMQATVFAGMAFSNASLGLVHAMSHSLGGIYDSPHGESNAILLNSVMEFNASEVPEKFVNIAKSIGINIQERTVKDIHDQLFHTISSLIQQTGISLLDCNIDFKESDLELLVNNAISDPCIVTNPKVVSPTDIYRIYEKVLR